MVICRSAADIFAYNVSMLVNGAYMVQELCCISSQYCIQEISSDFGLSLGDFSRWMELYRRILVSLLMVVIPGI